MPPPRKLPSLRKPEPEPEAPATPFEEPPTPPRAAGPRFSIRMLMMLMLVVAVASAGYGGMRQPEDRAFYVMFAAAAPVALLVIVGVFSEWLRRRRR